MKEKHNEQNKNMGKKRKSNKGKKTKKKHKKKKEMICQFFATMQRQRKLIFNIFTGGFSLRYLLPHCSWLAVITHLLYKINFASL